MYVLKRQKVIQYIIKGPKIARCIPVDFMGLCACIRGGIEDFTNYH